MSKPKDAVALMTVTEWYENDLMRYVKMLDKWRALGKIDTETQYRFNEKLLEWYENVDTYMHPTSPSSSVSVILLKSSLQ